MSKYSLVAIIAIAITLSVAGWLLLKPDFKPQELRPQTMEQEDKKEVMMPQEKLMPEQKIELQNIIIYTDNGFSPTTLTVKKGSSVDFQNNSQGSMWIASAFHPTHTAYPTTGGCIGSTFDSCSAIASGGSWSFQFDIVGSWKYHNHLNPGRFGTIIVE